MILTTRALRTSIDCRELAREMTCSLNFSGPADGVLEAAVQHAVACHGHDDCPELRSTLREALRFEP